MELLAPAGNFDSLKAAVACGADAVYLGMEKYGARASACNFDKDDLRRAIEFAHLRGVKVHVTVNTLIKNSEMPDVVKAVEYARDCGADAFIVQDSGLIALLREQYPELVLHASTQMGISNAYGAEYIKKLGLKRVVLARETLPNDIKDIKRIPELEVEVFCHGALCVAYSGNCYYSSLVSGCSGNRGKCLQLCRKKYDINGTRSYFLSAKDICLVSEINTLKELGVDSLKIEGRMRTPEYVAEAVDVYRKAIDGKCEISDIERLKKVFNRGDYCKAYFCDPNENVIYRKVQNNIGLEIGKVISVKNGKATLDAPCVSAGDGIKYLRNGYEVGGGTADGTVTAFCGDVKAGDEVRLTSSVEVKAKVADLDTRLQAAAEVSLSLEKGAKISMACRNVSVTAVGKDAVLPAENKALTKQDVEHAIGRLGGTDFALCQTEIALDDNVFYPVSLIKDMRKRAVAELKERLSASYKTYMPAKRTAPVKIDWFDCGDKATFVMVSDISILHKIDFDYDYAIFNPQDYNDIDAINTFCETLRGQAVINLPYIVRDRDIEVLKRLKDLNAAAFAANNFSQFEILSGKRFIGGIGLNRLNSFNKGTFISSIESDCSDTDCIRYVYGKPPYMHFAHCPNRTMGKNCRACNGYRYNMTDEKGTVLELRRIKTGYCYGVLLPSIPLNNISHGKNELKLIDLSYADDKETEALNDFIKYKKDYKLPCSHGNMKRKLQ